MGNEVRVVVAEDEATVAEMVKAVLGELGCEVVGDAVDGEQALQLTSALHPDLVMVDLEMSGMDGIEATRRIQETCPTPVVALTGDDSPDRVARAVEAGIDAYLSQFSTAG